MAANIKTQLPVIVAAGVVGYWCWTVWDESTRVPVRPNAGARPEIKLALLAPSLPAASNRDPFSATTLKAPAQPKELAASRSPAVANAAPAGTGSALPVPGADPLRGLILNGTYVSKSGSVAIINGLFFSVGHSLKAVSPAASPYIVARIDSDKVVLQSRGKTSTLAYANKPVSSAQPP